MPAVFEDPVSAVARVRDGDVIMVGGFGLVGQPLRLVEALVAGGRRDLTVISNNVGEPGRGLGVLLREGKLRKAIGSFFTSNPEVAAAHREGRIDVQLLPQGTLAEGIRCAGAGIPAFYTPTAAGTVLAEGKETRVFEDGRSYVLERAIRADVALVKAHRADRLGNLVYRKTARNFNPMMATAAELVIAEVEEVVEVGELDPDAIVTPHLYVDVVVGP
ncbi:MAG: CoA transferase subunit A [Candidatus Dormibacteraeota bacterium]|nr:CoA transferase subunit A [Candidatus Dormibacteraeota bacterium]